MEEQTNLNTCRVSELKNRMLMLLNKIVSKFVAKLIKYMLLFKDILTFLGLDYRDASLITLYLNVLRISTEYSVNQINRIFLTFKTIICCHTSKKSACY